MDVSCSKADLMEAGSTLPPSFLQTPCVGRWVSISPSVTQPVGSSSQQDHQSINSGCCMVRELDGLPIQACY